MTSQPMFFASAISISSASCWWLFYLTRNVLITMYHERRLYTHSLLAYSKTNSVLQTVIHISWRDYFFPNFSSSRHLFDMFSSSPNVYNFFKLHPSKQLCSCFLIFLVEINLATFWIRESSLDTLYWWCT